MDGFRFLAVALVAIAIVLMLQACQTYRDCRRLAFSTDQCIAFVIHAENKEGWK